MFDVGNTNDIVLLIWIGIIAFLSQSATKQKITVLGHEEQRYSHLFSVVVFFPIFWFVTTVYIRSDMYAYKMGFDSFSMSVDEIIKNWNSINKGPGFSLLISICKGLGINDFGQFRVVLALLQSIPLVFVFRKYSENYIYSIFLFIANRDYDGWMMNGMRQFLAVCIIFAAFPLFIKKKYIFASLLIFLAITVHASAVVIIPIFLLSKLKPWSKSFIILSVVFAVVLIFYIRYSNWMSADELQNSKGSHPLGILFRALPAIIAFVGRKQIEKYDNRSINFCVNISVLAVVINIVASLTSGIMTGRLIGYTGLFVYLLVPFLLKKSFNESISNRLSFGVTIYYILLFFLDMYIL